MEKSIFVQNKSRFSPIIKREEDSDGDGLSDKDEKSIGTDPYNRDMDGDKLWDSHDPEPTKAITKVSKPINISVKTVASEFKIETWWIVPIVVIIVLVVLCLFWIKRRNIHGSKKKK